VRWEALIPGTEKPALGEQNSEAPGAQMARVKPSQLDGGGLRALQPKPTGDLGKTESPVDGSGSHRLCGELKEAKRVKPSRNRESNQEVGFTNQFTRGGLGKTEPPSPKPETGSQSFTAFAAAGLIEEFTGFEDWSESRKGFTASVIFLRIGKLVGGTNQFGRRD